MIKRPITYTDYDGNKVTEVFYFNLNRFEWLELETYTRGGLIKNLQDSIDTNNLKKTIDLLKKIILRAYGERDSETGKFRKTEDLAVEFSKTEAFSELFYDLAYNEDKSREFFMGLIPQEMREDVAAQVGKVLPPPTSLT